MIKRSKGLGDTIDKITTATGIKKAVKAVLGEDCTKCEERRQRLNKWLPYTKQLSPDQQKQFKDILESVEENRGVMKSKIQDAFILLYNEVFNTKERRTSCPPCLKQRLAKLKKVYTLSCSND